MVICEACNENEATEKHHKFSQTKLNRKLYPDFIHDARNIQYVCEECHKMKSYKIENWGELKFSYTNHALLYFVVLFP
jgi:hypothetical protein